MAVRMTVRAGGAPVGTCDLREPVGDWICGDCDAGSGDLLGRIDWEFAGPDPLVSSESKSGFLELGSCIGEP